MPLSLDILQKTSDLCNHGTIVLNRAREVVLWNQWMVQASGLSEEQAIGKTLADLFGTRLSPRLQQGIGAALDHAQSSLLSTAFTPNPLPLEHPYMEGVPMTQRVVLKAFKANDNEHFCLIDITDVSLAASR